MSADLVSRKNFMLLGLSAAAVGVLEVACSSPDAGPPDGSGGSSGGGTAKGGSSGSGGATSGGASSGGATSGGASSGGASSGGASSGGASSGGASSGGTGGAASGGSGGAGGMCLAVTIEISCNHEDDNAPHMLTIPVEDVMAGADKPYTLSDNGTHDHPIMLTAAHFTTLRNGGTVHLYAESDFQPHCVTITCGVATEPTTAECAEDSLTCG